MFGVLSKVAAHMGHQSPLPMPVISLVRGPFCCYFFGQKDYVPDLQQIGLDPAVQGVPVKKKLSAVLLIQP